MSIQDQIEARYEEIARLKKQIESCQHDFCTPYQGTETKSVPIQENRPMGSDFFNPVTVGWKTENVPVWMRKCKKCGHIQTTTKTEAEVVSLRPVF